MMEFDVGLRTVVGPLGSVQLTRGLARIFQLLAKRFPNSVAHSGLETVLWGDDRFDRSRHTVNVDILRLRAQLASAAHGELIVSVHGYGYRLTVPVNVTGGKEIAVLTSEDWREIALWVEQRGGAGSERILDVLHAAR